MMADDYYVDIAGSQILMTLEMLISELEKIEDLERNILIDNYFPIMLLTPTFISIGIQQSD